MKRKAITTGNKRLRAIAKAAEAKGRAEGHHAAIDAAYRRAREELTSFVRVENGEVELMPPPRHRYMTFAVLPGRPWRIEDYASLSPYRYRDMVTAERLDIEWEMRVHAIQTQRGVMRVVWWSPKYHGLQLEPLDRSQAAE